ncbi:MAG: ABC transporter permease, partial [Bacteroides sp.]|nr:ABC transporter permease [Bacteroides sp.]
MTLRNILRIIKRDSLSLLTNMTGLSLGLAASILLTSFILFELSFDQHFSKADRIYRLNSIWIEKGERSEMPINLREAYSEIPDKVAGIESSTQLYRGFQKEVSYEENRYKNLSLLFADPEFFELFDLEMLSGSPEGALLEPNSVVLTETIADRIYGARDPLGQSFTMDEQVYTVSALVKDIPPNTHFSFDMLMPMKMVPELEGLGGLEFFTYYLLEEGVETSRVLETISDEYSKILGDKFSGFGSATFESRLSPLPRLHLHSGISWDLSTPGNIRTIYIMLVITIAVMGLALSNFINLYILNGARRSKEIGIRKVNGAGRKGMIRQFYLETTLVVSMAFFAGTVLAILLLHPFANIMQRESFSEISSSPSLYLVLAGIYLLSIFLSGLYPALLLSKAEPIPLIRGSINPAGDKKVLLRLVSVLQICIAISLLAILLGINTQIRYLKNISLGYHPENIVLIYNLNDKLTSNYVAIRDQLLDIPGIEEVAASTHTIGRGFSGQGIMMQGDDPSLARSISEYRIWPGLCQLYQFKLASGRFLEEGRTADRNGVILNKKAVKMLGKTPGEIVGESVVMHADPLEVIGVVEDFHFQSAAREIEPLILTAYSKNLRSISLRY